MHRLEGVNACGSGCANGFSREALAVCEVEEAMIASEMAVD